MQPILFSFHRAITFIFLVVPSFLAALVERRQPDPFYRTLDFRAEVRMQRRNYLAPDQGSPIERGTAMATYTSARIMNIASPITEYDSFPVAMPSRNPIRFRSAYDFVNIGESIPRSLELLKIDLTPDE